MSFGFSIGDIIAVSQLANKVRKRLVDSPKEFQAISDEVKSLSNIIRDLEDREDEFPNQGLTDSQMDDFRDFKLGCHNVLIELDKLLDKYCVLDTTKPGRKAQRVWKRLKWDPDDVEELRLRLTSNIALLNAFNGACTSKHVIQLHKYQNDQERQNITDWLSLTEFPAQQSDFIKRRQEGTGQWLLDSDEYKKWLVEPGQTFFCPGIPGAGKTILTAIMIKSLWSRFEADENVAVAFLYCNYKRHEEQGFQDLIASLLKQLVQKGRTVPDEVKSLHDRHISRGTRPSLDELTEVLSSVSVGYSRVFFLIDALDECASIERNKLLKEVFQLQKDAQINVFATSRFIDSITVQFSGKLSREIRASEEDIRRYLDSRISELPTCVLKRPYLQEEITYGIVNAVDGMFLLAQLHMDSLKYKTTIKAIKSTMQNLPKGSEALEIAYEEAVKRIEAQPTEYHVLAKRVISWIIGAKRPLSVLELTHALAIEPGDQEFDEDNIPELDEMNSVCAGLIVIDRESDTVRLVHYTTQEYFGRIRPFWMPDCDADIATACLTYLSFDTFEADPCSTDGEIGGLFTDDAFLDYAVHYWGSHARETSNKAVEQLALDFLADEPRVDSSSHFLQLSDLQPSRAPPSRSPSYYQRLRRQNTKISSVHLAAYHNLDKLLPVMLNHNHFPDAKDGDGRTPLFWAIMHKHEAIAKVLLELKDVNINLRDKVHWTPLHYAAESGNESITQLLLEKNAEVDTRSGEDETPLFTAACYGHEVILKLLLDHNAEVNLKDYQGQTPLYIAARDGNEVILKLLLDHNAEVNLKDYQGRTPFYIAAYCGREVILKLLLEHNAEVNLENTSGQTPLHNAARAGHEVIFKLLLDHNAEVNSEDDLGETPLHIAATNGHKIIIKLLLEHNADVNSKDGYGQTPLHIAAYYGYEVILKLLLDHNAEVNSKDECGQTPLHEAARHKTIVRLLLAKDADVNTKDVHVKTPLHRAAKVLSWAAIKLLLEHNAEVNAKDGWGDTPLLKALTIGGDEAVIRLFLGKNADVNLPNSNGGRPLTYAVKRHDVKMVKLLLEEFNADTSLAGEEGHTPLFLAIGARSEEMVRMLLEANANVNQKNNKGQTPLFAAAILAQKDLVQLLLEHNAEMSPADEKGRTPLAIAIENEHKPTNYNSRLANRISKAMDPRPDYNPYRRRARR